MFWGVIDRDLHEQIELVNRLIKPSLGQDRDRFYAHDRHPICGLRPSLIDGFTVRWIHYVSEICTYIYAHPAGLTHTQL